MSTFLHTPSLKKQTVLFLMGLTFTTSLLQLQKQCVLHQTYLHPLLVIRLLFILCLTYTEPELSSTQYKHINQPSSVDHTFDSY